MTKPSSWSLLPVPWSLFPVSWSLFAAATPSHEQPQGETFVPAKSEKFLLAKVQILTKYTVCHFVQNDKTSSYSLFPVSWSLFAVATPSRMWCRGRLPCRPESVAGAAVPTMSVKFLLVKVQILTKYTVCHFVHNDKTRSYSLFPVSCSQFPAIAVSVTFSFDLTIAV
jgi:hypothetical protein